MAYPLKVWDGTQWVQVSTSTQSNYAFATLNRWRKTMSGGEISLSGTDDSGLPLTYTAGEEQLFLNGTLLARGADYTATNGTDVVSLAALVSGDVLEVHSRTMQNISNTYTQAQANSLFVNKSVGGLNLMVPTSITKGASGTANLSANGQVTFSGTESILLNGVFNASCDNYKIIISSLSIGAGNLIQYQMSSNGTPVTTSTYSHQRIYAQDTTIGTLKATGQQSAGISYAATGALNFMTFDLMNPFLSTVTKSISQGNYSDPTNPFYTEQFTGYHSTAASYDGIRIIPGGSLISGTIRIYGYNNGA